MPTYDYKCNACEKIWEEFSLINDRDKPTENPCPECGEEEVNREVSGYGICIDTNVTPNKATGGQWNELMQKMGKPGLIVQVADLVNVGLDNTVYIN